MWMIAIVTASRRRCTHTASGTAESQTGAGKQKTKLKDATEKSVAFDPFAVYASKCW